MLEGADTASGALQSAVLHLITFPEVQKKAREELDRVIGPDRMPTVADLPNLPYNMAFVEEVHNSAIVSFSLVIQIDRRSIASDLLVHWAFHMQWSRIVLLMDSCIPKMPSSF